MISNSAHNALPTLRLRWRSLAWHGLTGSLFGYFVLHPAAMVIFQWLDPRMADAMPNCHTAKDLFAPIADSFSLHMLPMGLVFGVIGGLIAAFYSYHRLAICFQRDRLAEELQRNEKLRVALAEQAERLRQSNEELARLELTNRRTTQFMAHDFKTALNCVGGFANELSQRPVSREDAEVAGALSAIRRQAHWMMGCVSDLLQLGRMRERGGPPMQPVSVADVLGEAVRDFSLPAHAKDIALAGQHARCPLVLANPQLLRRVLCNLISNAVKHNRPGTHVCLDAQLDQSGREVVVSCRDDGDGVPPEALPSLFQEFGTPGDCGGASTGLGLAFCKAAVEAHHGRIWCEKLPHGTQFCFTIPLHKEHTHE